MSSDTLTPPDSAEPQDPSLEQRHRAMIKVVKLFREVKDPSDTEWILKQIGHQTCKPETSLQ